MPLSAREQQVLALLEDELVRDVFGIGLLGVALVLPWLMNAAKAVRIGRAAADLDRAG